MHETQARRGVRRGAAVLLAMVLALSLGWQRTWADEGRQLIPVGKAVGIKLFADGALVVGLSEGDPCPAKDCGLKEGDLILSMGDTKITSTEQVRALLQDNGCEPLVMTVRRSSRTLTVTAVPVQGVDGAWQLGAWIRDSMAGIGTMTYYDPDSGAFGALGHGITDVDTAKLMPLASGSIMETTVKAVKKGTAGEAGELRGDFDLTGDLGDLYANTNSGIFGTLSPCELTEQMGQALPVAEPDEVHTGPATIRSNVDGDAVRAYDIEILKVSAGASDGRELLISVTDPELIDATGGIVQGMSGSPILQDGKFVGAVTHVLLNDPTKGYGILLDTMLSAAQNNA